MSEFFLLDITFLPCKTSDSLVNRVSEALKKGVSKAGGNVTYCYKVIGEKHLIAVVEDGVENGVEAGVDAVNSAYGDQVNISCIPLRTYEKFATSVLGLEEATAPPSDHKMPDKGVLFWMKFTVGQRGLNHEDFMEIWKKEAVSVMMAKSEKKANFDLFKEAGSNVVYSVWESAGHDALDDLIFNLPFVKLSGENLKGTIRRVKKV